QNLFLKILSRAISPILMRVSCITIYAAVLASLIWIERIIEMEIRAFDFVDNRFWKNLLNPRFLVNGLFVRFPSSIFQIIGIRNMLQFIEFVMDFLLRPAAFGQ